MLTPVHLRGNDVEREGDQQIQIDVQEAEPWPCRRLVDRDRAGLGYLQDSIGDERSGKTNRFLLEGSQSIRDGQTHYP